MKTLFLDESGDHNLDVINPEYPVLVLGGVVMDADYAAGALVDELADFKRALFGHSNIALRTADIARNRNGFEPLLNRGARPLLPAAEPLDAQSGILGDGLHHR